MVVYASVEMERVERSEESIKRYNSSTHGRPLRAELYRTGNDANCVVIIRLKGRLQAIYLMHIILFLSDSHSIIRE